MLSRFKPLKTTLNLAVGFAFFTFMSGYGSCQGGAGYSQPGGGVAVGGGYESDYSSGGASSGGTSSGGYYSGGTSSGGYAPAPLDPVYDIGDIALTVYAPWDGLTTSFDVTIRDGGAYGDIVLQGADFQFDGSGGAAVDITDLPFGYYDLEVVGLDAYGASVSYAATDVTVQEPLTTVTLTLESSTSGYTDTGYDSGTTTQPGYSTYVGDVVLDILEPDGGMYGNPTSDIEYTLWDLDPVTGQYVFVEQLSVAFDPWNPPVIGSLELGEYYIEVRAFDGWGTEQYEFAGSFSHDAETTTVPIDLWYVQ